MLKYEFKERRQNTGQVVKDEGGAKVVEYRTGYEEFMVTHVSVKGGVEAGEQVKF